MTLVQFKIKGTDWAEIKYFQYKNTKQTNISSHISFPECFDSRNSRKESFVRELDYVHIVCF